MRKKISDLLADGRRKLKYFIRRPEGIAAIIAGILLIVMALVPLQIRFWLITADCESATIKLSVTPLWKKSSQLTYTVLHQESGETVRTGTIDESDQVITIQNLEDDTTYRITAFRKDDPISDFSFRTLSASGRLDDIPTNPSIPTGPTAESTVPAEPSVPTEPTVPTQPTDPTEHVVPTEPTVPTDPTQPSDPTVPTVPTVPVDTPTTGAIESISVSHDVITPPQVSFLVSVTPGNDNTSVISRWTLYAGQDTSGEALQTGEFSAASHTQDFTELERGWYTAELALYRIGESGETLLDSQTQSFLANAFEPVNPAIIDGIYRADAAGNSFYISVWNMESDDIWMPDANDYGTLSFSWRILQRDRTAVRSGETTFEEMEAANGIMFPDDLPFGQYNVAVDMSFVNEAGVSTLICSAVSDYSFDVFQTKPVNLPQNVTITVSDPTKTPALLFSYEWSPSPEDMGTMVGGEWFLENGTHGLFDYGTVTFEDLGVWIPTDALLEGENEVTVSFYPLYETPIPDGGTTIMWLNDIAVTITVTIIVAPGSG